jgi:hypothetical protein
MPNDFLCLAVSIRPLGEELAQVLAIHTHKDIVYFLPSPNNITITACWDIPRTGATPCGTSFRWIRPTVIPQGSSGRARPTMIIRCCIVIGQLLLVHALAGEFVVFHIHTLSLKALKSRY